MLNYQKIIISPTKLKFIILTNICSSYILVLFDYGSEINRGCRCILVVIDNFSNCGWTVPLKNETPQIKTNFFEKNFWFHKENQI